ncbi:MAG TPA: tripartite tricarboxylate transporter substrate binding protein [Burkholderiales bacterium]|nr:tripartite tricarboxylate transporter substrate binding protein [Burkholderiales bacterium]
MNTRFPAILACALATAITGAAAAQTAGYPTRPLRLIVPFPPGGGNDILARAVGQRLAEVIGQQVVVDNRGGAGGVIGGELAATAPPDGYTLFLGSLGGLAHNPALKPNLPYNPPRDFAPISLLATSSFIVAAHPSVPVKSIADLIALAKAKPNTLNYASAGPGSSLHMTGELFKYATGTQIVHVPYKGTGPALIDLVAGRTQLIFSTMPPALPHVKSGKLRALATTAAKRAAATPDVPTVAESGVKGFDVSNWQGIVTQTKVPAAIVKKLHADLMKTLALPGMSDTLMAQGLEPASSTPQQFAALIRSEIEKYRKLVVAARITVD